MSQVEFYKIIQKRKSAKPYNSTKKIVKEKIRQTVQLISLDNKMTSETEVRAVASEVLSLVRPRLAGARFSDYRNTWLFNHAKDVTSLLIDEFGCNDPAAIVAAVMGDVNYKSAHKHAWYRLDGW